MTVLSPAHVLWRARVPSVLGSGGTSQAGLQLRVRMPWLRKGFVPGKRRALHRVVLRAVSGGSPPAESCRSRAAAGTASPSPGCFQQELAADSQPRLCRRAHTRPSLNALPQDRMGTGLRDAGK